jgi:hypothetical protein
MITITKKFKSHNFEYITIDLDGKQVNFRRQKGDPNWYKEHTSGYWYREDEFASELNKIIQESD